jgi:hypothetical protein
MDWGDVGLVILLISATVALVWVTAQDIVIPTIRQVRDYRKHRS